MRSLLYAQRSAIQLNCAESIKPFHERVVPKPPCHGARVYVQGQNLLTFTKFTGLDPEFSANIYRAQYPMSRQFTLGVELNF